VMSAPDDLDRGAAVTRSLLGWGVVAGPFYVVVSLILALTRPGFMLSQHALSLLALGDGGWMQRTNLVLTGLMVAVAGLGMTRAIRNGRGLAVGALCIVDGLALMLSAVFLPDPATGFPPGSEGGQFSTSGVLHLLFGALGFLAITAAAWACSRWGRDEGLLMLARNSRILAICVLVGFVGGAALATNTVGVILLWIAVVAQFAWLALASSTIYRWSPHPLRSQRPTSVA
jgi:hypothetical membrane protein